jgi:hypothetical protein
MGRLLTLDDLQKQFDLTRDRLSLTRREILTSTPLPSDFSRDSYGFSYMRAERIGLDVIASRLEDIQFLPMKIDPQMEVVLESKTSIKRWVCSAAHEQPDSSTFGNDFIHALTRAAIAFGWQSPEFRTTASRIAELFHDLSCLIGLIYYGVWMAENGIGGVLVSDPYDLEAVAREISDLTLSPEVAHLLAERKRSVRKKSGPSLHVVKPTDFDETLPPLS